MMKKMKKRSEETQTLHAGCSKAEPKKFALSQTPFPVAEDGQNLISWKLSLPLPINPVWWGSIYAISSYRGNRPTNTHTIPQTWLITIHCTAASLARSVITRKLLLFMFSYESHSPVQKHQRPRDLGGHSVPGLTASKTCNTMPFDPNNAYRYEVTRLLPVTTSSFSRWMGQLFKNL